MSPIGAKFDTSKKANKSLAKSACRDSKLSGQLVVKTVRVSLGIEARLSTPRIGWVHGLHAEAKEKYITGDAKSNQEDGESIASTQSATQFKGQLWDSWDPVSQMVDHLRAPSSTETSSSSSNFSRSLSLSSYKCGIYGQTKKGNIRQAQGGAMVTGDFIHSDEKKSVLAKLQQKTEEG